MPSSGGVSKTYKHEKGVNVLKTRVLETANIKDISKNRNSNVALNSIIPLNAVRRQKFQKLLRDHAKMLNVEDAIILRANAYFDQLNFQNNARDVILQIKAAACLYIACRTENKPRTFKEISKTWLVKMGDLCKTYRDVLSELNIKLEFVHAYDFVDRFCLELGASDELYRVARDITIKICDMDIFSNRHPNSIAGACIYMSTKLCNEEIAMEAISKISDTKTQSIKKIYQIMTEQIIGLIPNDDETDK